MSVQTKYKELFENGSYEEAIGLLKSSKNEFDPALYHYNLGVNFARLERFPDARYEFELAKQEGLLSPELRKNLEQVKSLSGVTKLEEKTSFMDHVYGAALGSSVFTGINISLLLVIVVLTQRKRLGRWWVTALLIALSLVPAVGQMTLKSKYSRSISFEEKAVLMGPSKIFEQSQSLVPGMMVVVSRDFNGWRYIVSPESHKGWIKSEDLKDL